MNNLVAPSINNLVYAVKVSSDALFDRLDKDKGLQLDAEHVRDLLAVNKQTEAMIRLRTKSFAKEARALIDKINGEQK